MKNKSSGICLGEEKYRATAITAYFNSFQSSSTHSITGIVLQGTALRQAEGKEFDLSRSKTRTTQLHSVGLPQILPLPISLPHTTLLSLEVNAQPRALEVCLQFLLNL